MNEWGMTVLNLSGIVLCSGGLALYIRSLSYRVTGMERVLLDMNKSIGYIEGRQNGKKT